jgi:hypothetical protein
MSGVSGIRPVAMNAVLLKNGLCGFFDWTEKEEKDGQEEGENQHERRTPAA